MEKRRKKQKPVRFTAMSKLIGFVVIGIVMIVLIFSMYEMHRIQDISPLQYLICGTFAILASYIGFYINMAKAEHIEDKKNQIKKELELIRRDGITEEEKQRELELQQELEDMGISLDNLNTEEEIRYE
jgi:uncharacterized membrane protein